MATLGHGSAAQQQQKKGKKGKEQEQAVEQGEQKEQKEQKEEEHIEVDSGEGAGDGDGYSDYSSGLESDTTSLISAALQHTFENGRRFHGYKQGKYFMPNDEQEQDRMDLHHHCLLLALEGRLYTAPIKDLNPQRILDVGTGTGIWCIDCGDEFPSAEVTGVDLSPIQPQWVPPNVRFIVDDVEEEWVFQDNYFDYIHIRSMAGWLNDWPRLVKQAYRCLKPGGYIELQDLNDFYRSDDNSVPEESYLREWIRLLKKATTAQGKPWLDVPDLFKSLLRDEGCDVVREWSMKQPLGPWPKDKKLKETGLYARQMKLDGAEGFTLAFFTRTLGWDVKEVSEFLKNLEKDMLNPAYHSYERFYCIYGRKPWTAH